MASAILGSEWVLRTCENLGICTKFVETRKNFQKEFYKTLEDKVHEIL